MSKANRTAVGLPDVPAALSGGSKAFPLPVWYSSSFNWYYARPNRQITYPYFKQGREMAYDDLLPLYADGAAYRKVIQGLAAHASTPGAVWMVTNVGFANGTHESPTDILSDACQSSWSRAANCRAEQLWEVLRRRYAAPTRVVLPKPPLQEGDGEFDVDFFAPNPTNQTASTPLAGRDDKGQSKW